MIKYNILQDTMTEINGCTASRIVATRDFGNVKAGDVGGYVSSHESLSHKGLCWVHDDAAILEGAWVCDNAQIRDRAIIKGDATVCDGAEVCDVVIVDGAWIGNDTVLCGNGMVTGDMEIRHGD